jgi:hypothetical protein
MAAVAMAAATPPVVPVKDKTLPNRAARLVVALRSVVGARALLESAVQALVAARVPTKASWRAAPAVAKSAMRLPVALRAVVGARARAAMAAALPWAPMVTVGIRALAKVAAREPVAPQFGLV